MSSRGCALINHEGVRGRWEVESAVMDIKTTEDEPEPMSLKDDRGRSR